jgi:hypothetical protein
MTPREERLIFGIIITVILPFTIFSYAVQDVTIRHQDMTIEVLKDEICRLNDIIEELKEKKRACWIPSVSVDKPSESTAIVGLTVP